MNPVVSLVVLLSILFGGSVLGQSGPVPAGTSRYRITIDANGTDDVPALVRQLSAMCRGRVESGTEPGHDWFVVVASEAAVRVLASDSRVLRIEPLHDGPAAPALARPAAQLTHVVGATSMGSTSVATTAATAVWSTGAYTYDGAGNISSIGRSGSAIGQRFVYDQFGRLTSGMAGDQKQTYTYDRFGNIRTIARASVSGTPQNPIPTTTSTIKLGADAGTNRLSLRTIDSDPMNSSATYDDEGRLTQWHQSGGSFTYDALGMITTWSGAADGNIRRYIYTPNDERLVTMVTSGGTELSSEWTLRDASGRVLRRLRRSGGAWTWKQDYIYLNGSLLAAEVDTSAKTLHFFNDHLGSPRLITGNGGVQISRHDYLPFGEEVTPANQGGERLKFTGHERDESALDYMHARYYSSGTGRFLSPDPSTKYDLQHPQTWNRYSYAHNNPSLKIDPDGRDALAVTYVGYRVQTPVGRRPLGHSGITIVRSGGGTRYYEFGRYQPGGDVRYRGPFPDLAMKNGVPTRDSLKAHLSALSKEAGQNLPVSGAYFTNDTAAKMEAFAAARDQDPSKQGTYSLGSNNCATFCEDVLKAGGEKLDVSVVNTPENVMQELQDRADFSVHYDPKKDDLTVTCREGATCPP